MVEAQRRGHPDLESSRQGVEGIRVRAKPWWQGRASCALCAFTLKATKRVLRTLAGQEYTHTQIG